MDAYRKQAAAKDLVSRKVGEKEKTGVFTGGYAVNPATDEPIPVWIADYVLMEYGTGAIMAVPGHDERDFEFAKKFELPIVRVVAEPDGSADAPLEAAYTDNEHGRLVHSAQFDGMARPRGQARHHHLARRARGREGGGPLPPPRLVHQPPALLGPADPDHLLRPARRGTGPGKGPPVELPLIEDFTPDDTGISPLARHESWYHAPCPICGKRGRRETDVSDTFLDSAWYFLRYPSSDRTDVPFDPAVTKKWLPVTTYIGGNEHAVLHLLYSRFITMVLHDMGLLHFDEPFQRFRAHGLIVKDGAKMSKSRGNVVVPDEYIARWGADTFRMYLMFLGPFQEGGDFRDEGISGPRRFLEKVWGLVADSCRTHADDEVRHDVLVKYHQTVKRVTEGMEELRYNTCIAALMELVNMLRTESCTHRAMAEGLVIMLAPFAPHFAEESWERLGHTTSVFDARWPGWDEGLVVEDQVEIAVQVNGKTRGRVHVARDADEEAVVGAALGDVGIRRFTEGKAVRKRIYVANRLLNLVVG